MKALAITLGFLAPVIASIVLAILATFMPGVVPGPNGADQLQQYRYLNTLSFNVAVVVGLVGGATGVNLNSRLEWRWLLVGETVAVAVVTWLVPVIAWRLVAALPAPCAGVLSEPPISINFLVFQVAPAIASIVMARAFVRHRSWPVLAGALAAGFFAVVVLFSTIDNGVVEILFFHC